MADVVRLLRPRGAAEPAVVPGEIRELLGDGPLAWVTETARATTALVAEANPQIVDFPRETVGRSDESGLVELLVEFAGGGVRLRAMNEARTNTMREALAHGVGLASVLTTLRAVQQLWSTSLLDHAVAVGASPTVLREIAVTVARGVDSVVHEYTRIYPAESERLANTGAPRRRRVVEELLGEPGLVDPDVARQVLAIEPEDHHRCVVMRASATDPVETADLLARGVAAVETALAPAPGRRRAVVVEHERDEWWVWVSGSRETRAAALREMPVLAGLRIGAGGGHRGAAGFRRSTLEAREAVRMALRSTAGTLVLHEEVALVSLLSRDRERAGWFVESCLGPLASPDPQATVLRETLCAFYTAGMRPATTAAVLRLHRNTLVNRLRRIEAMLGHGATHRATEVYCALLLLDVYPDVAADRRSER